MNAMKTTPEIQVKQLLMFNIPLWIFNVILFFVLTNFGNVGNEFEINKRIYMMIIGQLSITLTVFSIIVIYYRELLSFFKLLFHPSLSIIYSLIPSVLVLIYIATGLMYFSENNDIYSKTVNFFIIIMIVQSLVFMISDKINKAILYRSIILLICGFLSLIVFVIFSTKIPEISQAVFTNTLKNKDVIFLSILSFFVIMSGGLELDKLSTKKNVN